MDPIPMARHGSIPATGIKTRASTSRGAIAAATCAKRSAPLAPIPLIKIFDYIEIHGSGSSP